MEAPLSRKIASYRCCRPSRLVKNVKDVSKYLHFQSYVRVYECTHSSCVLKPLIKMFGCHLEVTDAIPSLEGNRSLSRLTSSECYLWDAHTQRRALTLLSYKPASSVRQHPDKHDFLTPDTLPSDIFRHQSLQIPLFSGFQMQREEKQRREKVTLPISSAPVLACLTYCVFLWKCLEVYSPLKS